MSCSLNYGQIFGSMENPRIAVSTNGVKKLPNVTDDLDILINVYE